MNLVTQARQLRLGQIIIDRRQPLTSYLFALGALANGGKIALLQKEYLDHPTRLTIAGLNSHARRWIL